ncbi:MAG: hypothetical protein Q8K85_03350 [Hyphomicrobium sp.]|nr:hypothetical protein [Hyphomicrobium sp.]
MRWVRAFGWLPVPVFYVRGLFAGGFAPLVLILIDEKYRADEGLHQHELEHIEQAYRLLLLPHALLYVLFRRYRLRSEVAAYRRQIAAYGAGASIEFAVRHLVEGYRLGITAEEARALLAAS